jgi:CheY-specific phosphatase CheX
MIYFENQAAVLSDCVLASIENMAFADISPLQNPIHFEDEFHSVLISLGNLGEMDMSISSTALESLASVILTMDTSELDESSKRDTLMEIINIVAGRFCHDLIQENEEFQLGLPKLGLSPEDAKDSLINCGFAMDGSPAIRFRYFPLAKAN